MGRIFYFAIIVGLAICLSACQKELTLEERLYAYSQAQAEGDVTGAAEYARILLSADYSGSPLGGEELRAVKTDLAGSLSAAGDVENAISAIAALVWDDDIRNANLSNDYYAVVAPLDMAQAQSEDNLARADRQLFLGDLYVKADAPRKAFVAYRNANGLYSAVYGYGPDLFPGEIDLFKKRFYAARDAKFDIDNYCELIREAKSYQPDDRIAIIAVEYTAADVQTEGGESDIGGTNTQDVSDGYDQAFTAGYPRDPVTSIPEIDGELFAYWREDLPTCDREPAASYSLDEPSEPQFESLTVYYGTSRGLTGSKNVEKLYNAKPAALSIGSIDMTVPLNREVGSIQSPGLFDFKGAQDGVHIVLKRIDVQESSAAFQSDLSSHIGKNEKGQREAFIYVHGHGVKFSSAARRAAQLAVDLDMRNGGIFYSWPAGASATGYFKSQAHVDSSAVELKKFLKLVSETQGIDELHLIAHSMGNDVLSQALSAISLEGYSAENRPFGQIIWASPDVDAKEFSALIQGFKTRNMADGMTLYASSKDKALKISQWIWDKFPRAGQAPPIPDVAGHIQTIDTSDVDRGGDTIAHTDYAGAAIDDMRAVIWLSLQPKKRCDLEVKKVGSIEYWSAGKGQENCDKTLFRSAVTLARAEQFRYIPDTVERSVFDSMEHPEPASNGFQRQMSAPNMISFDPETGLETVHVANPYRSGVGQNLMKLQSSMEPENWQRAKELSQSLTASESP